MAQNNDYQVMLDMIKELEEQSTYYTDLLKTDLIDDGYNVQLIDFIFQRYADKKDELLADDERLKQISTKFYTGEDEFTLEDFKHNITKIYDVISIKEETNKLRNDADVVINDYVNYLTSPEYQEKKKKRIIDMKEKAEAETNDVAKKKILRLVDAMESTMSLSFLFTRLNLLGEKEKDNILKTFFDDKKSGYVIEKYKGKSSKIGFNPNVYKYFFNLEEKFLDEEYHVYNNLYLFFVMRYIAYADAYNKEDRMYCQSIFNNMANLIYHKFTTEDDENNFKNVMCAFLDYFKDDYEYFEKYNFTHPKHPRRIEKDNEHEKEIHNILITNIKKLTDDLNIEKRSDLDELSNDELRILFNKLDEEKHKHKPDVFENESEPELMATSEDDTGRKNEFGEDIIDYVPNVVILDSLPSLSSDVNENDKKDVQKLEESSLTSTILDSDESEIESTDELAKKD